MGVNPPLAGRLGGRILPSSKIQVYQYTVMTYRFLASFFVLVTALTLYAGQPENDPPTPIARAHTIIKSFYASSNPVKREMLVSSLAIAAQERESASLLTEALDHDKDPKVRITASAAMAEGKCRTCIPALKGTLDDKDIVVAFAAAKALWALGDKSGLPLLRRCSRVSEKTPKALFTALCSTPTTLCTLRLLWHCSVSMKPPVFCLVPRERPLRSPSRVGR